MVSRGIFALMQHPTTVTHECHCMLVVDVITYCLYVMYVSFLYVSAVSIATREWLFASLLLVEYTCNNLSVVRKKVMAIFARLEGFVWYSEDKIILLSFEYSYIIHVSTNAQGNCSDKRSCPYLGHGH